MKDFIPDKQHLNSSIKKDIIIVKSRELKKLCLAYLVQKERLLNCCYSLSILEDEVVYIKPVWAEGYTN